MRQKYMPIWGPMGSMGRGRWAKADGPGPMGLKDPGLEDPPVGVYFRARGRWGPMGSMGLGDPPMGVSSSKVQTFFLELFQFVPDLFPDFYRQKIGLK